jgi:ATP-dependent Clp protease ATP-binding subunit ClpC
VSALTVGAHLGWRIAGLEAQRSGAGTIGVDHLLVGLLSLEKALEPAAGISPDQRDAVLAEQQGLSRILADCDIDAATLRRAVRRQIPPGDAAPEGTVHRDAACRAMFERASVLARDLGNVPCGPLHLLTALVEAPSAALYAALPAITTGLPGPLERLNLRVRAAITPTRPAWKTEPVPPPLPSPDLHPLGEDRGEGFATPPLALLRYGRDLTAEAEAGRLPPVVGRRDEMLQVVRVLRRRTKNSPVLVGEAGVGKTTVVEGLARRIAEGSTLPGRRIVALSLASVVAGTSYRGQFEERLEEILAELRKRRDVILFLDELHTIVGAGDADGSLDAANILKPALARGEIACIGATTLDEYRRHIESDPALERRFQPVLVSEPSPAEAREMLAGLRADLEQHHGVSIDADALDAGVELTVRYVTARRLPDKAVDALDEACARTAVPGLSQPLAGAEPAGAVVTRAEVAAVVSAWTGISLGQIGQDEASRLADLEARLGRVWRTHRDRPASSCSSARAASARRRLRTPSPRPCSTARIG